MNHKIKTETKKDFIEFLIGAGALRFGDFTLKSGRKSPYFINAGAFDTGEKIDRLGYFYAKHVAALVGCGELPGDIATVFGPAYKGIPIATATAGSLSRDFGIDIGYTFNRKEAKDHGEGGNFIGKKMNDGDRIVIVDDVITAGTAVREIVPLIKREANVTIAGLVLSADRMERGRGMNCASAVNEVRSEFGIPVFPIVNVRDIFAMVSGLPGLFTEHGASENASNSNKTIGITSDDIPDELPGAMAEEIDSALIRRAIAYMDEYCV